MNSKFNIEQLVRLAQHQHSFSGTETKDIHCNNPYDQEKFAATKRTTYKPRAAIFISENYRNYRNNN